MYPIHNWQSPILKPNWQICQICQLCQYCVICENLGCLLPVHPVSILIFDIPRKVSFLGAFTFIVLVAQEKTLTQQLSFPVLDI